jgi:hypothetical protein
MQGTHHPSTNRLLRRNLKMKLKKVLAATLAATMVLASVVTVSAGSTTKDEGSSTSSTPATYADENAQEANATITVGGKSIKTTIGGVYAAKSLDGIAVITDLATIRANLGLAANQIPVVIIYDTDTTKSVKAMDSVNAAIAALGDAKYVTALNIDLGAKQDGKWITLANGSVQLTAGLPASADKTKTYSVVCVQPGGAVTILDDQDADPNTLTFDVQAGLGTYAVVAQ